MSMAWIKTSVMALAFATIAMAGAWAQAPANWPTKPVRIIVNYAPGGSTDNATRPFMERLSQSVGQQFVIENKGGASGAVGVEAGVRSAPDGYTFFVTPVASLTILPNARPTAYDPFKDMVPVSWYADSTLVFAIHPSIPANSMQEFVAYAKKNPGKIAFGSSGLGTLTQMICEVVNLEGGIDMLHVPYRGGAESLTDFLAGQVQVFSEGNVLPHVKSGKAKLLAVVDTVRHPDFPDVPTLREVFPNADIQNWFGMFAPAGTPEPIVRRMAEEMAKAAKDPTLQAHLLRLALRANGAGPDVLAARVRKDYDLYGRLVKDLKIRMD
ncbi:MAG: Bug family tripartite tricarboxylate transporter substrate binding protein [Acetobacteraceae bacterium]